MKKFLILMAVFCATLSRGFASGILLVDEDGGQSSKVCVNFTGLNTLTLKPNPDSPSKWIHFFVNNQQTETTCKLNHAKPAAFEEEILRDFYDLNSHETQGVKVEKAVKMLITGNCVSYDQDHSFENAKLSFMEKDAKWTLVPGVPASFREFVMAETKALKAQKEFRKAHKEFRKVGAKFLRPKKPYRCDSETIGRWRRARAFEKDSRLFKDSIKNLPSKAQEKIKGGGIIELADLTSIGGYIESVELTSAPTGPRLGYFRGLVDYNGGGVDIFAKNLVVSVTLKEGYQWKKG